ncbi:flagellar filament capping protein FliD [Ferrimonas lipolytica]|uniref:Flagellar hook-associated protein 2 n=1 Tax=Ferrimonas lipolytica TaxID=2724191 RepID=A0A6H1UHU5_9GAMM|nr:flagellar filament capping protein FliD [Ferrimonas lipolytica]QIZ77362.1 flagellar filament capping protein FliD [Ferrimonas lipolytica]
MGLTSTGMGSGLDINSIVTSLVDASYSPRKTALTGRVSELETQISALGTLKSSMTEFQDTLEALQDPETFGQRTTSLSQSEYLDVEASPDAVEGSYNLTVNQLAESQKLGSAAVADADATVGEGQLQINVGLDDNGDPDPEAQLTIDVNADDTLADIVDKINGSEDNPGVTATIINSDDGPRLIMTSDETGVENELTISATDTVGTGLTDTFGTMDELVKAQDSEIVVDGITITSSSNEVDDAVNGLTLNLTKADPDETTKLTIDMDTGTTKTAIEDFVEAYNAMAETIADLTEYDAEEESAGALQGDSMTRGITSILRSSLGDQYNLDGQSASLSQFGVSFDAYGKLEIDEDMLDEAIENDVGSLTSLFSAEDTGLAYVLDENLEYYLESDGLFETKTSSYESQIDGLEDDQADLLIQEASYEDRLFDQYNAMDSAVYSIYAQLDSLLANLGTSS